MINGKFIALESKVACQIKKLILQQNLNIFIKGVVGENL